MYHYILKNLLDLNNCENALRVGIICNYWIQPIRNFVKNNLGLAKHWYNIASQISGNFSGMRRRTYLGLHLRYNFSLALAQWLELPILSTGSNSGVPFGIHPYAALNKGGLIKQGF